MTSDMLRGGEDNRFERPSYFEIGRLIGDLTNEVKALRNESAERGAATQLLISSFGRDLSIVTSGLEVVKAKAEFTEKKVERINESVDQLMAARWQFLGVYGTIIFTLSIIGATLTQHIGHIWHLLTGNDVPKS